MFPILISICSTAVYAMAPTFYFRTASVPTGCPDVQTFNDGYSYGPCNGGQGAKYGQQSKYWAAIYDGASHCGQTITVKSGSRSIDLVVMDVCPGCQSDNHVDMGLEALIELGGSPEAACAINRPQMEISWSFKNGPPGNNSPAKNTPVSNSTDSQTPAPPQKPAKYPIATSTTSKPHVTHTRTSTAAASRTAQAVPSSTPIPVSQPYGNNSLPADLTSGNIQHSNYLVGFAVAAIVNTIL
jgi:hypothetical protein